MRPFKIPKYPARKHAGGQARITDRTGRAIYLGRFGTPESTEKYRRVVTVLVAHDGVYPRDDEGPTVGELVKRYLEYARTYYVKRGSPTAMYRRLRLVLSDLEKSHGSIPAVAFRQADLRALRTSWVADRALSTCNQYAAAIVAMYGWAAGRDLIPAESHLALRAVERLKPGRCAARVNPPIGPATQEEVAAVLADLDVWNPTVAAMVRVQKICAMRPQEVCYLRPGDLWLRDEAVWRYVVPPEANKKDHEGRARWVSIGPKAQAILQPFLTRAIPPGRAVFPPKPGHPASATWPGYHPRSYYAAIERSCRRTGVRWSPNQLRHAGATEIRARADLDTARATLGHSDATTSADYAERDWTKMAALALEIG